MNTAGPWTVAQIYQLIRDAAAGPGDFARIAPSLTVRVQDVYTSQAGGSASTTNGRYTGFAGVIYLNGVNSSFTAAPDASATHEYGHIWTWYHLYLDRQGDWSSYLSYRGLAGDSRLDSSYAWSRDEISADDYRLLFGTAAAVSQRPRHLNSYIADPRDVTGLRDFFLTNWA